MSSASNRLTKEAIEASTVGVRFNQGKARWGLLPWDAVNAVVDVFTDGAHKYSDRNWEKGLSWTETADAMMRHFTKRVVLGERNDPESGLPHFAHMVWNALALLTFDLRNSGTDDLTCEKVAYAKLAKPVEPQRLNRESDRPASRPS